MSITIIYPFWFAFEWLISEIHYGKSFCYIYYYNFCLHPAVFILFWLIAALSFLSGFWDSSRKNRKGDTLRSCFPFSAGNHWTEVCGPGFAWICYLYFPWWTWLNFSAYFGMFVCSINFQIFVMVACLWDMNIKLGLLIYKLELL